MVPLMLLACRPSADVVPITPSTTETLESAAGVNPEGTAWSVVRLAGEEPWAVVVGGPPEPEETRFADGAPVTIATIGGLDGPPECGAKAPNMGLTNNLGAVTVLVLGPDQCCMGVCGGGSQTLDGSALSQGILSAVRFASGELVTTEGYTLEEVAGVPLLDTQLAVLFSSLGTLPGLTTVASNPDDFARVGAITIYEPPLFQPAVTGALGILGWDQDRGTDANGSGCSWDDGANPWYTPGSCTGFDCALPTERLAWDASRSIKDFAAFPRADELEAVRSGMLFIDGDGDGVLSFTGDGWADIDGSGAIDTDEDFPLPGSLTVLDEQDLYWQPTSLLQAALDQGVISASDWPEHLIGLDEVTGYWDAMDPSVALQALTSQRPELYWEVTASWSDHGVALCSRPHMVELYETLRLAGASVRFNPDPDALYELSGAEAPSYSRLPEGEPLTEAEISRWLPPDTVRSKDVRDAGVIDALDWLWAASQTKR